MIEDLKDVYTNAAIKHGEATEAGNHKEANRQYKILIKTYKDMLASKDHIFEGLLEHSNNSVRLWSAVHSLPFEPEHAREVIAEVAKQKGLVAFNAEITLQEYDKGSLKIDGYHFNTD